ncbi:unnamed protein product, partial [Rotaria socialis]
MTQGSRVETVACCVVGVVVDCH